MEKIGKIRDVHRLAKDINRLAHYYPTLSAEKKLKFIDRISGRIILICEDLEEIDASKLS